MGLQPLSPAYSYSPEAERSKPLVKRHCSGHAFHFQFLPNIVMSSSLFPFFPTSSDTKKTGKKRCEKTRVEDKLLQELIYLFNVEVCPLCVKHSILSFRLLLSKFFSPFFNLLLISPLTKKITANSCLCTLHCVSTDRVMHT